jgi:hypothetical protein
MGKMCRLLGTSRSGFYVSIQRAMCERRSKCVHDSPPIWPRTTGIRVGRKPAARLRGATLR